MKKTTSSLNKCQNWSFFPNCQKMTPEAADAVHGWHLDDKSKDVIDEGVQSLGKVMFMLPTLVYHHPPCRSSSSKAGGPRSSACSWWRAGWKIVTVLHISIINFIPLNPGLFSSIPEGSSWWSQRWGESRNSCRGQSCTSPCARCRSHCDAMDF